MIIGHSGRRAEDANAENDTAVNKKVRAALMRGLIPILCVGENLKRRTDFDPCWKVALDTTHILGRGAVKDTYNLLAGGIKKLIWTLWLPEMGARGKLRG